MKDNIILALDTTASPLLVTVTKNGKTFSARKSGIKQEEYLFPTIKKVLAKAGAQLGDVNKVFYVRGPGRFTGIRIGLTLASMLRSLVGAEAAGATMFETLRFTAVKSKEFKTWQKANPAGMMAVVLHAFREEYFIQIFDGSAPQWFTKEDLFAYMDKYRYPLFVIGFDKDRSYLDGLLVGTKYTLGSKKLCGVSAKGLAEIAEASQFAQDTLEPLYLKPARFELGK
ncbi:tRNA threonylcarbamoyl adenosine modification protein YeaZ [Elusimicrobium simillimum]|uniref:tRNA (adenosine(37)-N6)-threonylcarbamoyltransferase complex dimerization subunit type 1 TsaB n=1 Tax=Elusimicrobium simillimum TaxID=3143438 RepID=UPI003C704E52